MKSFMVPLLLMCTACVVRAQSNTPITLTTYPDLTGNGSTQQVQSSGMCRWVLFVPLKANSAVTRIGDINVGVSRGIPVDEGGGMLPPVPTDVNYRYALSSLYFYGSSGDKLSVTCGN